MSMQISISNAIGGGGGAQGGGTPTPPPFSNLHSFSFDGIDDYFFVPDTSGLSFGNGTTDSPFSISTWVKFSSTNTFEPIVSKYGTEGNREYMLLLVNQKVRLYVTDTTGFNVRIKETNAAINLNSWYHICATYNGVGGSNAQNGINIYVNGVLQSATGLSFGTYTAMSNTSQPLEIAKSFLGFSESTIDETAIFTTELSASDITAIYNNGEPQSLDAYSPFVWFRMGDNATWNGATWTMTSVGTDTRIARSINMVEANRTTDVPTASSFTNTKSILLDGVDDFVNVPNSASLQITGALTISFWIYGRNNASHTGIITKTPNTSSLGSATQYHIQYQSSNQLRFAVTGCDLYAGQETTGTVPTVVPGVWQHITMTWNGTNTMTVYKDGTQVCTKVQSTTIVNNTSPVYLGQRIGWGHLLGNLDEVAVFNSELSASDVSTIYNGGVPNDISSLSPLSWWRCGDGDTSPTLTDNGSSSNNGTMTNFTTFSTDVPT